jgi:hypothetical protein
MRPTYTSLILFMTFLLSACRIEATAFPTITTMNNELTLAPGQSATLSGTDMTITFESVVADERCPIDIECAASGPVTVSLSIQQGGDAPNDFTLQTFTDQEGRSPNVQFEGVTNRAELGNYRIQIASVTPYPRNLTETDPAEYRVTLLIYNQ